MAALPSSPCCGASEGGTWAAPTGPRCSSHQRASWRRCSCYGWSSRRPMPPKVFPVGILFGLVAGFLEELGWTGYAYPRMAQRQGPFVGALVLGLLWGLWHLPVVDSLGAAAPHGRHWLLFFGAFVMALTALRVLIAWIYNRSASLLMAQLMHASSTGFLVVLGAPHVTATQEATWYALYGLLLATVTTILWRASGIGMRSRALRAAR